MLDGFVPHQGSVPISERYHDRWQVIGCLMLFRGASTFSKGWWMYSSLEEAVLGVCVLKGAGYKQVPGQHYNEHALFCTFTIVLPNHRVPIEKDEASNSPKTWLLKVYTVQLHGSVPSEEPTNVCQLWPPTEFLLAMQLHSGLGFTLFGSSHMATCFFGTKRGRCGLFCPKKLPKKDG